MAGCGEQEMSVQGRGVQVVSNTLRMSVVTGVAAAVGFMALRYVKRNIYI